MLEIVNFQINIELGPVEMIIVKQLDILYRAKHLVTEVRIILVVKEVLFAFDKKPNTEWRYVLNAYGNALSKL